MIRMTQKQQRITSVFLENGTLSSSLVYKKLLEAGDIISLVTVKRTLSAMAREGILSISGARRTTVYSVTATGRIFANIDPKEYCRIEPDKRYGLKTFNLELLPKLSQGIFTEEELKILDNATLIYEKRTEDLPTSIQKKELERLVIELSWKSSKIEGNTYTLLDTEKLILENKEAVGHDKKEALMILNHKDAFNFVHECKEQFKTLTRKNLEELHKVIIKGLDVDTGLRRKPVGVLGSVYRPLDNIYQITEALDTLSSAVSQAQTPYAKAILALLGTSYIQPFADGNKRTSRLIANAVLLAHKCAPLSYRSVDENEYREAMLVFYELNSVMPIKKIFINQYKFAAENYAVK